MRKLRQALFIWATVPGVALAADEAREAEKPRAQEETLQALGTGRTAVFAAPRAASVVDKDELRTRPARTSAEALTDEEGVFVQRPVYGLGSPVLRGLGGQRVVLVQDGIRLNTTLTTPGANHALVLTDPNSLEALEVVRGAGVVLHGSDGLGGVVQARTRTPLPIAGSDVELSAWARGVYSSFDQGGHGTVGASGRWGRYAVNAGFSLRRIGELSGGSLAPQQTMTGYNDGALSLGTGVDLGRGTLVLAYQGGRQFDAVRTDLSTPLDVRVTAENARDLAYLRYSGSFEPGGQPLTVTATASYQRQRELRDRRSVLFDLQSRDDNGVDVAGVQAQVQADAGKGGQVVGGVDGYFEWVSSAQSRGPLSEGPGAPLKVDDKRSRYPRGSGAQSVGAFVQDDLDLERLWRGAQSTGRLRALVGARLGGSFVSVGDDARLGALRSARRENNLVYAGSAHLRYEPLSGLSLVAGFQSGVRAPNLADTARLAEDAEGTYLPAGEALKPEVAYGGELGLRAAYRKAEASVAYGFTRIDQAMTTVAAPAAEVTELCAGPDGCPRRALLRENADAAQVHALEATGRLRLFGGLSLFATVNFVQGQVRRRGATVSEPLPLVPPLNGVAALQLRRPRSVITFAEVSLRWASAQNSLAPQDLGDTRICPALGPCPGTPGFMVLALRGAARLSRYVYVTGAVENVTNNSYRYHGSGVDGPGLGGVLSLETTY